MQTDESKPSTLTIQNLITPAAQPCSNDCKYNTFYFIETMDWMLEMSNSTSILKDKAGILYCPGCNNTIGLFNWISYERCGSHQCTSGVSPRFQIEKKKIQIE